MKTIKIKSLGINTEKIKNIFGKSLGFMFHKKREEGKLFIFQNEKRVGIHMFFVFFPLIIIWINSKKEIIKIKVAKPFCFFHEEKARYLLEIPYNKKILKKIIKIKKLRF